MTVKTERPHILRLTYRQEKTDPDYGSCMWAFFDFDIEKWMLSIQSDCGEYAYRWPAGKGETFLELCARIHDDYLLHKLCGNPEVVNAEATIEGVIEWMTADREEDEITENEKEAIEELKEKECELNGASSDGAAWILDEWANDYGLEFDCLWERVSTEYSGNQKKIIEVFRDYIQPSLKDIIETPTDEREPAGIVVTYNNGDIAELAKGCCVDLDNASETMNVEMLEIQPEDIIRLTYGLVYAVDKMRMGEAFRRYATGEDTGQWIK